jgi:hypothetical protein
MLLRIAPDMFTNPQYECVTIRQVYEEIARTPKFKTKYPWIRELRGGIKFLSATEAESQKARSFYDAITALNDNATINTRTQRIFDLSREDRWIIACAAAHAYAISSGDGDLRDFAVQQFDASIIFPLEVINSWIAKNLIAWNDEKQACLKAWADKNEHAQPFQAKKEFRELTGMKYEGN